MKRIKEWFSDQRDFIVYQKKYWKRSNFFIFLNWLSRDLLATYLGLERHRTNYAMEILKEYAMPHLNQEYGDSAEDCLVRSRLYVQQAIKQLERAEEMRDHIFKI